MGEKEFLTKHGLEEGILLRATEKKGEVLGTGWGQLWEGGQGLQREE